MSEQDTAREAAYREWVAELKRQGEKERHQDIITAFNAAWAAGVEHGRVAALALNQRQAAEIVMLTAGLLEIEIVLKKALDTPGKLDV